MRVFNLAAAAALIVSSSLGLVRGQEHGGDEVSPTSLVRYSDRGYDVQASLNAEYVVPLNGQIEGIRRLTLTPIAFENDEYFIGGYVSGGLADIKSGTVPDGAIVDTTALSLGASFRRYFNNSRAFVSPYFSADVSLNTLIWRYSPAVISDGDVLHHDGLFAAGGYTGLGIAFNRRQPLSFFVEAGVGGWTFANYSYEDFKNDVFHDFGYYTVKAGVTLKF